jgi:hypothetical protein
MLLPEDVHPINSLYFNGAHVLEALRRHKEVKLIDLYLEMRARQELPMPLFVLTLDWLFLADLATMNSSGNIEPCL